MKVKRFSFWGAKLAAGLQSQGGAANYAELFPHKKNLSEMCQPFMGLFYQIKDLQHFLFDLL